MYSRRALRDRSRARQIIETERDGPAPITGSQAGRSAFVRARPSRMATFRPAGLRAFFCSDVDRRLVEDVWSKSARSATVSRSTLRRLPAQLHSCRALSSRNRQRLTFTSVTIRTIQLHGCEHWRARLLMRRLKAKALRDVRSLIEPKSIRAATTLVYETKLIEAAVEAKNDRRPALTSLDVFLLPPALYVSYIEAAGGSASLRAPHFAGMNHLKILKNLENSPLLTLCGAQRRDRRPRKLRWQPKAQHQRLVLRQHRIAQGPGPPGDRQSTRALKTVAPGVVLGTWRMFLLQQHTLTLRWHTQN
eukprot:SAG31_NODE_860_length_11431_cov_8.068920_10_plen_305_part_00